MNTEPLFDHDQIEQIMNAAKSHRVSYLSQKSAKASGVGRWGGLGVVAAAALALLVTHGIHRAGAIGDSHPATNRSL